MGCIIKIKGREEFKIFDTEEEARNYVKNNNLVIETHTDSAGNEIEYVRTASLQESTLNIIKNANEISYKEIGEDRTKIKLNDWNTEEFGKHSSAASLSIALKKIMVQDSQGNYKRLFPEFITNNYLNVLIQRQIAQAYVDYKQLDTKKADDIRSQYFDKNLPAKLSKDGELYSAQEWYNYFKTQINNPGFTLDDNILASFDESARLENESNFDMMLRGEVMHKILEVLIQGNILYSSDQAKERVWKAMMKELSDPEKNSSFYKKYAEDYDDVPNAKPIIDNLFAELENNNRSLFNDYFERVLKAKTEITEFYKQRCESRGEDVDIKWLSEQKLTSDLDVEIDGKKKIRGKIDGIIVVNGIPHVVDLKVSRNNISDWASEKLLKTKYQLGMYWRLLGRLGVPVVDSDLGIYNISLNEDKTTRDGNHQLFNEIKNDKKINTNLDSFLKQINPNKTLNKEHRESIDEGIFRLFGEASVRGQREATEERMIESLRDRVQTVERNENGNKVVKYRFRYNYIKSDGTNDWAYSNEVSTKDELNEELARVAKIIVDGLNNKFSNQYDRLVTDIKDYLNDPEKSIGDFAITQNDKYITRQFESILLKYRGSGAKIIYPEVGKYYNMIFIETPVGIDTIICSALDPNIPYNTTDKNALLFEGLNTTERRMKKTVGNVEICKALIVLNEILKGSSSEKIGTIQCIQLNSPKGYAMTSRNLKNSASIITQFLDQHNSLTEDKFSDPLANIVYMFNHFTNSVIGMREPTKAISRSRLSELGEGSKFDILKTAFSKGKIDIGLIKQAAGDFNPRAKVEFLKDLREYLRSEYSSIIGNVGDTNIVTPETLLLYYIEQAISIYENREFSCETDISKYGINSGFVLASLDLIPSENAQIIRKILDGGYSKVRDRFNEYKSRNRAATRKLKDAKSYGKLRELVVGDHTANYTNLFRKDITDDLVLKNPWDPNSNLIPEESDYIKHVLFELNRRTKRNNWKTWRDIKESDFNESDYFVPLVRAKGLERFRDPNGGVNLPTFKGWWDNIKNEAIGMKDTLESQLEARKNASNSFKEIYNEFTHRTDPNIRKDMIEQAGGIKAFSWDLELVLDSFTISMESSEVFNNEVIPEIVGSLYLINYQSLFTGQEMNNLQEFITDSVKSNIYNDSIMNPELQAAWKYIAPLRQTAYMITLGWNVMNVPREVIMGLFTNMSRAMFGAYGKDSFTVKDLTKSLGIMIGDVPNFIANVTKIELLNEKYGLANMSINEIPEQATSNKTGMMAMFSRFMSWSLTAPDYWNRMSMFIAQMIHDGTWDAYELEEGEDGERKLVYKMEKDKRFELFVKYKGDIKAVPERLRADFNRQAALYEAMREEMNNELSEQIPDYKSGETIPALPKAYTNLQRDSFKSFADMSFGYYDKETKAWFFKTAAGGIFKQFMAYLSAKKMSYFQVRSDQTARGSFEQLTDTSGNKIWSIILEDGTVQIVNDLELNDKYSEYKEFAKPKLVWTGTYMEGILQSYMHLFHDLSIGTWEALNGGGTETLKRVWQEYGKKGDIRHSNLLQGLWDLLISSGIIYLIRLMFFQDPEVTGVSYKKQLEESSAMAQNLYWIVDQSAQDFSIMALLRQGVDWQIPTWTILQGTGRRFWKALGDEDLTFVEKLTTGTVNSVGMLRPFRPVWNEHLSEK